MMLHPRLYALILRAILNEECLQQQCVPNQQTKGKKTAKNGGAKSGVPKLDLADELRRLVGTGIDEEEHLRLVEENRHWVAFKLHVSVVPQSAEGLGGEEDANGFLLQIVQNGNGNGGGGDHPEEHFLLVNAQPVEITLPHGRRSLLRLFPMNAAGQGHNTSRTVGNSLFYRPPSPNPRPSTSRPLHNPPPLHPSSTSSSAASSSTPSLASNDGTTTINQQQQSHAISTKLSFVSNFSAGGSFLRRWTRPHGQHRNPRSHRKNSPLLTVRLRDLPANRQHSLPFPCTIHANSLRFELKKTPANVAKHGDYFVPLELGEFVTILRAFKAIFLREWKEYVPAEVHTEESDGTKDEHDDLAKAFRHFNETVDSAERLREILEKIVQRVAQFNDISPLARTLVVIGVNLEDCKFDNVEKTKTFGWSKNNRDNQKQKQLVELAKASIQHELPNLKNGPPMDGDAEVKAALFLAERLAQVLTQLSRMATSRRLFIPNIFFCPEIQEENVVPLGRRLARHFAEFEQFQGQISPFLDLLQSPPLSAHPGLSGLCASASRLFDQSLQQQLAEFISADIGQAAQSGLNAFGDLVDTLRLFLANPAIQNVEAMLERLWMPFTSRLLQTIDDPLSQACQSLLRTSIGLLNARDHGRMLDFTKQTMRLFDAFGQLSQLTKPIIGEHCSLHSFEEWFEPVAVYWTGTWRTVYIGFMHKCVDESTENANAIGTVAPISALDAMASTSGTRPATPPPASISRPRRSSCFFPSDFNGTNGGSSPPPLHLFSGRRGSRPFLGIDFRHRQQQQQQQQQQDVPLHEATVTALAFCKALCDDFCHLKARHTGIRIIGTLQIASILSDCLSTFSSLLLQQVKAKPTFVNMLRAANGIEHASGYLCQNFERFMDIGTTDDQGQKEEAEMAQALGTCRHILGASRAKCRAMADQIVASLCERKVPKMRNLCAAMTRNWDNSFLQNERAKKPPIRHYIRHVLFSSLPAGMAINERRASVDHLLLFLDKSSAQMHLALLARLQSTGRLALWHNVRHCLEQQTLRGQTPDYYEQIEKACQQICQILQLNWAEERSALRRLLHANKASTRDLILQYYGHLADLSAAAGTHQPAKGPLQRIPMLPRLCIRIGQVRTTGQQILLQIQVISASDLPALDTISRSSDPYVRLELLPRFLFPLSQFPAQNTDTKRQTLSPKWNQIFQIAIPEDRFFMNGACLCLTVLDYDVIGHNDLAGQVFLRLAQIPRLNALSTRMAGPPMVLPMRMPQNAQYAIEAFQILEQRGIRRRPDEMAKAMTKYEKYIRDYHVLPPSAEDAKEWPWTTTTTTTTTSRTSTYRTSAREGRRRGGGGFHRAREQMRRMVVEGTSRAASWRL